MCHIDLVSYMWSRCQQMFFLVSFLIWPWAGSTFFSVEYRRQVLGCVYQSKLYSAVESLSILLWTRSLMTSLEYRGYRLYWIRFFAKKSEFQGIEEPYFSYGCFPQICFYCVSDKNLFNKKAITCSHNVAIDKTAKKWAIISCAKALVCLSYV